MWIVFIALMACGSAEAPMPAPIEQVDPMAEPTPMVENKLKARAPAIPFKNPNRAPGPVKIPTMPKFPQNDGSCVYEPFEGRCTLLRTKVSEPRNGRVSITGYYDVIGQDREVEWRTITSESMGAAVKANFEAHADAECVGRRLVKGDCGAGAVRVILPPTPAPPK